MPRDEIQENLNAEAIRLRKQRFQILHAAEPAVDRVIVGDIVSAVVKGRHEDRVNPHDIRKLREIGQFFRDPLQVADPVSVAVVKRGGIDVVDHRFIQIFLHSEPSRQETALHTCRPRPSCTRT